MDTNSTDNDDDHSDDTSRIDRTDAADNSSVERAHTRYPKRRIVAASAAVVVAAAALAASVVYTVHSYSTPTPTSSSVDRNAAVLAARSVAATMVNVKGGDGDGTLKSWRSVITGDLADQYAKSEPQLKQRIDQSTTTVTSTVTNAALSEFDHASGKAVALVFVDTTRTDTGAPGATATPAPSAPGATAAPSAPAAPTSTAPPATSVAPSSGAAAPATGQADKQRQALTMSLTRTSDGWKASDLKFADPTQVGK